MNDIREILRDQNWQLKIEVDPNEGGDGTHVRIGGDTNSFRKLANLLTIMADTVDDRSRPEAEHGWHFALADELPQLTLENAKLVAFDCTPIKSRK